MSVFVCSVEIVRCKHPGDSMLCAKDITKMTEGEKLRAMRLCRGITISEAAKAVGVSRHTIINYELKDGLNRKKSIVEALINYYNNK